jgi:hypothetical protein
MRLTALAMALAVAWLLPLHARAAETASFRLDVAPLLSKAGCNAGTCHGNFNGKGGFRLTLRGDDPGRDYLAMTRDSLGRRINRQEANRSLLYLKPAGLIPHGGGQRFRPDSDDARAILQWIADGAGDDIETAPRLVRLTVSPEQASIDRKSREQALKLTAEFSDGSLRDVTSQASYDLSDPVHATIDPAGVVYATEPLEVTVSARYMNGRATSRLVFLPDRPDFQWSDPSETNVVDQLVFAKLKAVRILPSELANDSVFLRRVYLDTLGILPTPEETRAFLADDRPEKRDALIDRLVKRPEFADFWALKWADLLRNEEKTMGEKGVWTFQRWLRDQIAAEIPMDQFVRRIIAAKGSTWRNPPSSFYRTNRDPETAAEAFGQVFLGVRLQCAKCHNHPFDTWTQDDYYGLAAYFSNIERKQIANVRKDNLDKHEINGDEIIYVSGEPEIVQPSSGEKLEPKPLGGPRPELCGGDVDALESLADWLTQDNPQFVRNMVNRVWYHLLGRGIVDPVDDFRESNPPSNPALLDALADEFTRNEMKLQPLVALILKSRTYQLDSAPNATNAGDEINFSRAVVHLLPAEVLLDALSQTLDKSEPFRNSPRLARATQLPGVRSGSPFLRAFGKPERLLTCECERSESTTLSQAFQLINGETIRTRLESSFNRIAHLMESRASDDAILDELTLAALCRFPTDRERAAASAHLAKTSDRRKGWEDLAWALLNSKEFLLRH